MSYLRVIFVVLLLAGGVYYMQSPEKKDEIKGAIWGKVVESVLDIGGEDIEEGSIGDEEGNWINVLFHGKPYKNFDCENDGDCNLYVDSCDDNCLCNNDGRCYVLI